MLAEEPGVSRGIIQKKFLKTNKFWLLKRKCIFIAFVIPPPSSMGFLNKIQPIWFNRLAMSVAKYIQTKKSVKKQQFYNILFINTHGLWFMQSLVWIYTYEIYMSEDKQTSIQCKYIFISIYSAHLTEHARNTRITTLWICILIINNILRWRDTVNNKQRF